MNGSLTTIEHCYAFFSGNIYNQPSITKTLVSTPNNLDGYIPRNQKLRSFPFMYIGFNPTNGTSKIFRYENFANGTPIFHIISEVNPNPSVYFIPQNYRGSNGDSMSDLVSLNGFPTLSSRSDSFNTWLAQNSQIVSVAMNQEEANYNLNQLSSGFNGLMGLGSNVMGGSSSSSPSNVISGIQNVGNSAINLTENYINHDYYIKGQMAQVEKQKMLPDKGSISSSNATLIGYNLIDKNIFTRYTIKNKFAKRIDDYFDMYGYQTNELKIPNINNRPNWNYVKLTSCNIIGDIPDLDLVNIKNMFLNGVTLWHKPDTFLDYSQNNR